MPVLHLDYETRGTVDLPTAGFHKYAAHPDTRICMLGWAFGDESPALWEPHKSPCPPDRLMRGLADPSVIVKAFNAPFERLITHYQLGISVPYERWQCAMVKSYYLGFTGGLDAVCEQIGLRGKDPRGQRLNMKFCKPAPKNHHAEWYDWTNAPEDWQAWGEYCIRDVEAERELDHWLDQYPGMPDWDWWQYSLDQRINDRGVPLDVPFATRCVELWDQERARLDDELRACTGLPKATREPFLALLQQQGVTLANLRKDYLKARRSREQFPPAVEQWLDLYQAKEAKAAAKYNAVLNCVQSDGRARGMFQYKGASRTDRVGGRRLQLQNLKHPLVEDPLAIPEFKSVLMSGDRVRLRNDYKVDVSQALGGAIRHVIQAPPGKVLTVADLTSIESVVLGWVAQCPLIDQTFRAGRDSYRVFGSEYYRKPYDEVTKDERKFCKPPVLGCGYMLGWVGLIAYAEGYGVKMTEEEARRAVETFRNMYPEIKAFWWWLDDAIKHVVNTGREVTGYRLRLERDADFLRIWLPSGRALSYFKPEIRPMPAPWDPNKLIDNFTYMGKKDGGIWTRISAHPGGVTENIVQSIAGDILWWGIGNCMQAGIDIILHVHDETAAEAEEARASEQLELQKACMTRTLPWAPDMWLGASGMITRDYTKD